MSFRKLSFSFMGLLLYELSYQLFILLVSVNQLFNSFIFILVTATNEIFQKILTVEVHHILVAVHNFSRFLVSEDSIKYFGLFLGMLFLLK
jgi:hypothetical protein